MQKDYRTSLAALGVLVVLVLLIACANVANLMTAQAAARSREMALRVSIGAKGWRLGRLVLVEAAIMGLLASVAGWCFARWSAPLVLARVNPPDDPARLSLAVDWRAFVCAAVLTLFVSLLFGLAPALRASAIRPVEVLRGDGSSHSRARWMRALIALQAAFCFSSCSSPDCSSLPSTDCMASQTVFHPNESSISISSIRGMNPALHGTRWQNICAGCLALKPLHMPTGRCWTDTVSSQTPSRSMAGLPRKFRPGS